MKFFNQEMDFHCFETQIDSMQRHTHPEENKPEETEKNIRMQRHQKRDKRGAKFPVFRPVQKKIN